MPNKFDFIIGLGTTAPQSMEHFEEELDKYFKSEAKRKGVENPKFYPKTQDEELPKVGTFNFDWSKRIH